MSVTFSIEGNTTGAFTATCFETDEVLSADSYEAILAEVAVHRLACTECDACGIPVSPVFDVPDISVNLANTNARMLLARLDLDLEDLCGSADGSDFLGRVLVALASDADDSGIADVAVAANHIECGVPAGYFADRLTSLHEVALEATRLGRAVTWA